MKIRPVAAEMFHADGQTDMTKLIVGFHNFVNAPNQDFPDRKQLYRNRRCASTDLGDTDRRSYELCCLSTRLYTVISTTTGTAQRGVKSQLNLFEPEQQICSYCSSKLPAT
jgi:hypothetical protein